MVTIDETVFDCTGGPPPGPGALSNNRQWWGNWLKSLSILQSLILILYSNSTFFYISTHEKKNKRSKLSKIDQHILMEHFLDT